MFFYQHFVFRISLHILSFQKKHYNIVNIIQSYHSKTQNTNDIQSIFINNYDQRHYFYYRKLRP